MSALPRIVAQAIRCGPPFDFRDWRRIEDDDRSPAERAMAFVEQHLIIPDGPLVGQRIELDAFQQALFYQVIDTGVWQVVFSMARKNAKTATTAALLLSYVVGPLKRQNDELASAANSRDQAAHIYKYASKMLELNPALVGYYKLVPSHKTIIGTVRNVTFRSISSEAKSAHGGNYRLIVVDELGQVREQTDEFFDALVTGQGAQQDPKMVIISTQAPTDNALFSTLMDSAVASDAKDTAVHLYMAEAGCALDDEEQWARANPAMGRFRSITDIRRQCEQAMAMPSAAGRFRNLILNQRVAAESLFIPPDAWRKNNVAPDIRVLQRRGAQLALDLSQKTDLTAAVFAAADEERHVHLFPHAFTPRVGLEARAMRDRAPYVEWLKMGVLNAPPGEVVDYDAVCLFLKHWCEDNKIDITRVAFDRWRINDFKKAAERCEFAQGAEWVEVGQGFKDMSPRLESFEGAVLRSRVHHGSHPVLNMAAACAVVVRDPTGGRKLDKTRATQRIDPLVAAVMASHEPLMGEEVADVAHWIA